MCGSAVSSSSTSWGPHCILSERMLVWFGDTAYKASEAHLFPDTRATFISVFMETSKADPMGKGATRFFPAQQHGLCFVNIMVQYLKQARPRAKHPLFVKTTMGTVSADMVRDYIKGVAFVLKLDDDRYNLHSMRIG